MELLTGRSILKKARSNKEGQLIHTSESLITKLRRYYNLKILTELLRGEGILKKGRSNTEWKIIYRSVSLITKLSFITT